MARPLRIERAGEWYHITSRGNERKAIYRDEIDRRHFLEVLEEMTSRFRVRLHCFVLMDNHYHLMLELTESNLSRAVQWLQVAYSVWFNRRHSRSGHLFQGRFKSVVVNREEWGLELSRYVHLNPVRVAELDLGKGDRGAQRVGLAPAPDPDRVRQRIGRLRSHRWSSYRAYVGLSPVAPWLECRTVLGLGGGPKGQRQRRYREYVERALREGLKTSPWESLHEQVVLGGAKFLAKLKEHIAGDEQEQRGAGRLLAERPELWQVIGAVERVKGQKWDEFRERHGDTGRDLVLYLGRRLSGLKLRELATAVGLRNYAVVATNTRRFQKRLEQDKTQQIIVKKVLKLLNCKI